MKDEEEKKNCKKIANNARRRNKPVEYDEKALKKASIGLSKKQKKNLIVPTFYHIHPEQSA